MYKIQMLDQTVGVSNEGQKLEQCDVFVSGWDQVDISETAGTENAIMLD